MNTVNLIPREARTRREGLGVSPPTLALIGGLVLALVAAVLYVTAANTVATRQSELSQVTAGVAGWTAAANSYDSFVSGAQRRTQELTNVRQLASSRFPWSNLLGQIGGLLPPKAALSTLQADSSSTAGASTPSASGAAGPGVQLTGCAASQSAVAETMVRLRLVHGISGVTLASTSDTSAGSGGSGSTSGQGSVSCPFAVQFQMSLTFKPSTAAPAASSAGAATPSAPAATTSTPAATTSTPGATTPAPAATTSTPAAAQ